MASVAATTDFVVWGIDQTAYGPVELPTLVSWVKDERVTADTWIYVGKTHSWHKAPEVPELQMFFRNGRANGALRKLGAVQEGILRRSLRCNGEYRDQVLWSMLREDWGEHWVSTSPRVH